MPVILLADKAVGGVLKEVFAVLTIVGKGQVAIPISLSLEPL